MTDPLLTIGAFARAAGLTPSALRHYDDVGLLPPADVDTTTGYRYYTPDLIRRASLLARMREIGLPVDTMRTVLDGRFDEAVRVVQDFVTEQLERSARAEQAAAEIIAAVAVGRAEVQAARIVVDGPELAAALRQVRAAADLDRGSPLGSVLLDLAGGRLDVVATNRYWLAVRTLQPIAAEGGGRVVLAPDDALLLADLLEAEPVSAEPVSAEPVSAESRESDGPAAGGSGPGGSAVDGVALRLERTGLVVAGQRLDARDVAYPDHRAVLAGVQTSIVRAVVARAELVEAIESIRRAEVDIAFTAKGLQLCGVGRSNDTGAQDAGPGARTDVLAPLVPAVVTGADLDVRLSAPLLLRGLATAVGPSVTLSASQSHRPIVLGCPYQRGFTALIMPIRRT